MPQLSDINRTLDAVAYGVVAFAIVIALILVRPESGLHAIRLESSRLHIIGETDGSP